MKFVTTDYSVRCMRETPEGDKEVASFDIDLQQIAPHVQAALYPHELNELKTWLTARSNLQDHLTNRPDELSIIDVLPALLKEASEILISQGAVDLKTKERLKAQLSKLSKTLDQVSSVEESKPKVKEDLGRAEFLKAKLDIIKKELSKNELD